MSLDTTIIKTEPGICYPSENNKTNDSLDSKQVLDLSMRSPETVERENDNIAAVTPEFVSIKMEIDAVVKQEPSSDPEDSQPASVQEPFSEPSPVINSTNGLAFEVVIKQESVEVEVNCVNNDTTLNNKHDQFSEPPGEGEQKGNTSNFITVTEKMLRENSCPDGKYMCPTCQNRFATKGLVQRHQVLHTYENLKCKICSKAFVSPGHLKKHILSHASVKSYDCPDCGKNFRTTSNLEQHRKTHLKVKPFKCDVCEKQFAVRSNLLKHQAKTRCNRPPDEPISCEVCHKTFRKEFLLKSHLRRHTTEKPYTCETCDLSFKYKSTLIRHIQLHNGIKPYSCNICQKTFTHAGLIKPHMRKHTGEKPYTCPVCKQMFAHKHNMERHCLRHNKIKHLDCLVCHKKFPKESRLRYHMKIHSNEKPFSCGVCPKKFSHRQNVLRHYTRKHPGKVYVCEKTDASVARDIWEAVIEKKAVKVEMEDVEPIESCESNDEYVLP